MSVENNEEILRYTVKNSYCNFTINAMEVYYQTAMLFYNT